MKIKRDSQLLRPLSSPHQGAALPLMAVFIILMFSMAALSMDLAYLELVNTELRAATDAAARAAASALIQGDTSTQVQAIAVSTAALNNVAGNPLTISPSNVTLGQSVVQSNGTYSFQAGTSPYQAVQVTASLNSLPLFFGYFVGVATSSPSTTSVAAASACDVCLVLDRSHSMCWDDSGTDWLYPSPPYPSQYAQDTFSVASPGTPSGIFMQFPPEANSRWVGLQTAVQSFTSIVGQANGNTHVAVVTWASPLTSSVTVTSTLTSTTLAQSGVTFLSPYTITPSVAVQHGVTTDVALTSSMSAINSAVAAYTATTLIGGTDMYHGIEGGIGVLTGSGSRPAATKIMILMTDGDWSSPAGNTNPTLAATDAKTDNIKIHCIAFTTNANQTTMQTIASTTGGNFYYASNSSALNTIFQEIAGTLPVALTQ